MRLLTTVVPYGLLAMLTAFSAATTETPLIDLGLCAVTAVWMLWMFPPRTRRWRPVAFLGLLILTLLLVLREPAFGLFTPAAYIYAFAHLPWPGRLPAVTAVAVVASVAQSSTVPAGTPSGVSIIVAIVLVNIALMTTMAWVLHSEERAMNELSRALAENTELQERLVMQAREAGVLSERQRMAREIHDTVAQGLTGIIAQLQAAEQRHPVPPAWERPFELVKQLARDSLTEARRSVDALRPSPLESGRLAEALDDVATRWSALHNLPVRVTITGTARPLVPEAEFALLRTAQEALANVAKHARASRAGVTLSYLEDAVALDVVDDGAGFVPGGSGGFGLTIMRQRVEAYAGTLQIESEPGAGTGISARIPLPPTGSAP